MFVAEITLYRTRAPFGVAQDRLRHAQGERVERKAKEFCEGLTMIAGVIPRPLHLKGEGVRFPIDLFTSPSARASLQSLHP